MLYLVDGTSDEWFGRDEAYYDRAFATGFCHSIKLELGPRAQYFRGPTVYGVETRGIANKVADDIKRQPAEEKIFLCGYSRGGAAVIAAANWCGRPVEAMFLLDAVDSTADYLGTSHVPGNVGRAYHAIRDPDFAAEFDKTVAEKAEKLRKQATHFSTKVEFPTFAAAAKLATAVGKNIDYRVFKRRSKFVFFANTGLKADAPCQMDDPASHMYQCTHGAMGGLPWPDVAGDKAIADQVGTWMRSNMIRHGHHIRAN